MIITCPNCLTRYDVNPVAIGDGKSTRCSNCAHSWFQQPVATAHPAAYVQQQQRNYAQPQYRQPGYPPPSGYPPQLGYPVSQYPPPQQQSYATPAPEAQPALIPEPETEPAPITEPEPEPAPIQAPEPIPEPELIQEHEPEPAATDDDPGLSSQELDEMFGDDDTEPFQSIITPDLEDGDDDELEPKPSKDSAPFESIISPDLEDGDDQSFNPDDLPDPEPIPGVFTEDDDELEPKPRKIGQIIGICCAALIVILLISGFLLKTQITHMIPAATGIYDMIGIGGEEFGAGLKIQNVKSSREKEKGQEVLFIRGTVKNISDVVRTVPMIQIHLFDGDAHSIQSSHAAPVRNKLDPGKTVSFKARLVEPSPLARKLEVTFKKPEDGEGHNENPKARSR